MATDPRRAPSRTSLPPTAEPNTGSGVAALSLIGVLVAAIPVLADPVPAGTAPRTATTDIDGLAARNETQADRHASPPLFESPSARRARLRAEREQRLSQTLGWLPGVVAARVHLTPEQRRGVAGPVTGARALAVLRVAPVADRDALRAQTARLVAAAVPDQEHAAVEVVFVPAPATSEFPKSPPTTRVGPFSVAKEHAGRLRTTLAVLLGLNAALALALVAVWRASRSRP